MKCDKSAYKKDKVSLDNNDLKMFYTSKGNLTRYAFSCGYIEKYYGKESTDYVKLFMEHTFYHILGFISGKHITGCFDNVTSARKFISTLNK